MRSLKIQSITTPNI